MYPRVPKPIKLEVIVDWVVDIVDNEFIVNPDTVDINWELEMYPSVPKPIKLEVIVDWVVEIVDNGLNINPLTVDWSWVEEI